VNNIDVILALFLATAAVGLAWAAKQYLCPQCWRTWTREEVRRTS